MIRDRFSLVLRSRWLFRVLLAVPAALAMYDYVVDSITYGEVIHASGDWSARLLIVTMAVTPIRMLFPGASFSRGLMERRRDLGVATFGYALLHTLVYLQRKANIGLIVAEGAEPGLWTGWLALFVFALLALTSNDASVRALRLWWKKLHGFVYVGAVLTFAHWLLTAFDIVPGLIYAGILAAIEATRVALSLRSRQSVKSA